MGEEESRRKRPRRYFSDEFKRDAVEVWRSSGKSIKEVARELGIHDSSLSSWVHQDRVDRGDAPGLTRDDRDELTRLRKEVRTLRREREILKRATAFWVKESDE